MSAQDDNPSVGGDGDSVAELNARLERKNEEIRIIQQVSAEVIATLELDEILKVSLRTMEAALEFQHSEELLHLPYCQRAARPIFMAFVDLLKPKDAAISVRPTTKVVIQ